MAREGEFNWSLLATLSEALIIEPLRKYTDPEFAKLVDQFITHIHHDYTKLVITVSLDSLSRHEALPLLIEHFFALHGGVLINLLKEDIGGPNLIELLEPDRHPIAVVLEWFDTDRETPLAKIAFPNSTGTDKQDREMVSRWAKGTQTPDLLSIKRISDVFADRAPAKEKEMAVNFRRWMVVARALSWLEEESPLPFRRIMRRHLLQNFSPVDIGLELSTAVNETGKRFSALTLPGLTLHENLKRTSTKEYGKQAQTRADLVELLQLTEIHDPEGRTKFYLEWLQGRWNVLSGRLTEALPHFQRAVELASYRAGNQQKQILEEALVLAALLEKKPFLNQIKHRAVSLDLLAPPRNGNVIEDWEIAQLKQQFHRIFPNQGRFPEATPMKGETFHLPFLIFNQEELEKLKPDLKNPDRIRKIRSHDGQERRIPQLILFTTLGDAESVDSLLKHGASVDQLDDAGGSALLCAIQRAKSTNDRRILDLLLERSHAKSTLDSVTKKKNLTPLICAIKYGRSDIVEKLLAMGASTECRGNIINDTPLYLCIKNLWAVKNPSSFHQQLLNSVTSHTDLSDHEIRRRHNANINNVFFENKSLYESIENPRQRIILEEIATEMTREKLNRFVTQDTKEIIERLLKSGANPNAPHAHPQHGRTPLMLAAEIDCIWAFELMMQHQGDYEQKDDNGVNCLGIAIGFGSSQIVNYLRKIMASSKASEEVPRPSK